MATKPSRAAVRTVTPIEVLPFHAAVPRLASANADLTSDMLGPRVELHADASGVVRPQTPDEVRLADALGLPVLRPTTPDETAAEPAAEEET